MIIKECSISDVKVGDTVIHHGVVKTVCKRSFSENNFVGVMIWGDSYNLGRTPVKIVIYPRWFKGVMYY